MGILSLLQGIFPTQGSNPGLPYCRRILYQLSHKGSPRTLEWVAYPFSQEKDLPDPGIEPGSPALQADSLPTELSGMVFRQHPNPSGSSVLYNLKAFPGSWPHSEGGNSKRSLPHCCEKEWRPRKKAEPDRSPADPHTTARGLGSCIKHTDPSYACRIPGTGEPGGLPSMRSHRVGHD